MEKLVHAFIFSRLNYCDGVLAGLSKNAIRQLQLIQNAAARVLTRTKKVDHITPVLRSLHWLPVYQRIDFKIRLLVYKALNGFGPKYISDLLPRYGPSRRLRSSGTGLLSVPKSEPNMEQQHSVTMHHISGTNSLKIAGLLHRSPLLNQD